MVVASPLSGRLVGHFGSRPSLVAGGLAVMASALMLTQLRASTATLYLIVAYVIFGIGSGLVNPPITNTAVSGMPPAQAGVAAAIASTSRQVGMTLGVAVLGAVAGGGVAGALGKSFATATHPGWWIIAVLGAVVLVLGFLTTTEWARETARQTATRLGEDEIEGGRGVGGAAGARGRALVAGAPGPVEAPVE
jgi:MFS family permease